ARNQSELNGQKEFQSRFIRWPTAAPDGQTLVYESVGRLWRMDVATGASRRLTNLSSGAFELMPAWSPNGRWVAFASWDDKERGHLWKVDVKSGDIQRLTRTEGEYLHPAWSPNGRFVYAAVGEGATARGEWLTDNSSWQVGRVASAGGSV